MTKTVLSFLVMFIILVLAQAVVFNHLTLWGVAIPLVFIYWILSLPVNTDSILMLSLAFLMGLTVDVFSDTPGQNALACTLLAAVRKPVLRLYLPREEDLTDPEPSAKSLGAAVYMKYVVTLTAIYCTIFFLIESFTFFNLWRLGLQIVCSTVLTFILILALDSITHITREKRL
ncbi:MAG: rod shape-determining protein MreD [Barnesiella sp.]|nr:rod shape-determining protein MreD [Barnesiella sp.]MBD5248689.1 rod shape-determining protein MreD [Barnesiella sp.]MDE6081750.1 rod shape-determining protein MreD [Muribaculaceae bacterium]